MCKPPLTSALCAALTACMLTACATSTPSPRPLAIATCGIEALEYCPGPHPGRGQTLAETEVEDAANRNRWQECVERQRGAADCLRALRAAGILRDAPE